MEENFQYMDTSLNFIHQFREEETNQESYFSQNNSYNNAQELQTEVEIDEQNEESAVLDEQVDLEEEEVSQMKYQEADALIRAELKEVILKKETERTNLKVLCEHKNIMMEQIKFSQDLTDQMGQETEELNINIEIENDELHQLQKRLQYNGEIVSKLEQFIKTIDDGYKEQNQKNQEFRSERNKQKEKFAELNRIKSNISRLKLEIEKKKVSCSDIGGEDGRKEEIAILRAKVKAKREELAQVQQKCQEIDMRKEKLVQLHDEKQRLEEVLIDRNRKVQEKKDLKAEIEKEIEMCKKDIDGKMEEKVNRLKTVEELKQTLQEKTQEYERLVAVTKLKEEYNVKLEEKIASISAKIKDCRTELQTSGEKWERALQVVEEKREESQNKLDQVLKENDVLRCNLETLKQDYIAKVEEKCEKLLLKSETEERLRAEEVLLNKIKEVDKENADERKLIEDLSQKIKDISTDNKLQEMEKKNAYLISSKNYLMEKFENIRKQVEDCRSEINNKQELIDNNSVSIEDKEKIIASLLNELQELKKSEDNEENYKPPPSILKSPMSHKLFSTSPKKVKFEGFSSYDSSASSSQTTQPSIAGKSFDEIMAEMMKATFRKPAKTVKRRKVDFD